MRPSQAAASALPVGGTAVAGIEVCGEQAASASAAGTVTRRAEADGAHGSALAFDVTRDGRPVPIDDYLGAKGHLVALREGDLAFLHVHPDEDRLRFAAEFPSSGRYRLFLQFRSGSALHTAAFTEEVER